MITSGIHVQRRVRYLNHLLELGHVHLLVLCRRIGDVISPIPESQCAQCFMCIEAGRRAIHHQRRLRVATE